MNEPVLGGYRRNRAPGGPRYQHTPWQHCWNIGATSAWPLHQMQREEGHANVNTCTTERRCCAPALCAGSRLHTVPRVPRGYPERCRPGDSILAPPLPHCSIGYSYGRRPACKCSMQKIRRWTVAQRLLRQYALILLVQFESR